jgi:hypothetical protein
LSSRASLSAREFAKEERASPLHLQSLRRGYMATAPADTGGCLGKMAARAGSDARRRSQSRPPLLSVLSTFLSSGRRRWSDILLRGRSALCASSLLSLSLTLTHSLTHSLPPSSFTQVKTVCYLGINSAPPPSPQQSGAPAEDRRARGRGGGGGGGGGGRWLAAIGRCMLKSGDSHAATRACNSRKLVLQQ